jgi:hypothetical protein
VVPADLTDLASMVTLAKGILGEKAVAGLARQMAGIRFGAP